MAVCIYIVIRLIYVLTRYKLPTIRCILFLMKRFVKKYLSTHHYLAVLRRQPSHMQHVYAAFFAGAVTVLIAAIILYFDYGFWHERYSRTELVETNAVVEDSMVTVQSPTEMLGGFFKEASQRLQSIKTGSSSLLEGKDVYTREK